MKLIKRFYTAFAALFAAVILWACGPAEVGYTEEWYIPGLYTVNKATVAPEFTDTFYFVRNIDEFDLKTGERAMLLMHCYFDAYSGQAPQWNIKQIIKKIPVYPLSPKSEMYDSVYTTPVTALQALPSYYFYNEFEPLAWVWDGKQNINIKFKGVEETASYAMTVRDVNGDCVELDLWVDAEESDKEVETLLTFDISNIADFVDPADKSVIPADIDSIKTKVYVRRMKNDALIDWGVDGNYIRFL